MSRFPRIRRRPDHFASTHERARVRAAERLDGPLGLAEATWLDAHLAECAACAAVAAAYESDRQALRGLAATTPEPPRDLWARTAAAIEREAAGGRLAPAGRPGPTPARRRLPLGALSGVAVVALVVGASLVSQTLIVPPAAAPSSVADTLQGQGGAPETAGGEDSGRVAAQPTPFAVGAGAVGWVRANLDGTLAYTIAPVDEVCPAEAKDGCGTLSERAARRLQVIAEPETIIASPDDETAILVGRDAAGRQQVVVIDLDGDSAPTATPAPDPTDASAAPTARPASPTETPGASASPETTPAPPTETPEASTTETDVPSGGPASAEPSGGPESPEPSGGPVATEVPTPTPSVSPEPGVAANLADGVQVVGQSAAFSADGAWFAFTARSIGGSGGPNVYVWQVGAPEAQQLTTDDRSTFASWVGGEVLVSRPIGRERGRPTAAVNVRIDPSSGVETAAGSGWRPTLDPSGTRAVVWTGGIVRDPAGDWRPDTGQLVLTEWADGAPTDAGTVLVDGDAVGDFDVRWDETGSWFAVWIADEADASVGTLDLYRLDPATGAVDQPEGAPVDVRALAGFSIGHGRLAWATPPGQEGEGSRVQVVAWNADGVGGIETEPGEDVVVIR